jgi:hypothetical protein
MRQALLDDDPDGQDTDADPWDYEPVLAPSELASEWQLTSSTPIKCNYTEEDNQFTYSFPCFLAYLWRDFSKECLEDIT